MKKVYLIYYTTGEYEDRHEIVFEATLNKSIAGSRLIELNNALKEYGAYAAGDWEMRNEFKGIAHDTKFKILKHLGLDETTYLPFEGNTGAYFELVEQDLLS